MIAFMVVVSVLGVRLAIKCWLAFIGGINDADDPRKQKPPPDAP